MPFNRTKHLRLSVIKQIELEASYYPDVVSLAQGIPSFDTPGCIKRRVERALKRGVVARYSLSPGLPELREMIEVHLARENMYYDWEKEIIVTAGSIEGITAAIMAITEPGDEVIIPEPTYTSYREVITLAGCTPVFVPLDEARGWSFDLEKFEQAITDKTKAIFYCNPNNPTGTVYSEQELRGLLELAVERDLFIITDDVYKDILFEQDKLFSIAEIQKHRERIIRVFSLSKVYAMTGWRIGYLHADAKVAQEILKVHDQLVTCAPVISQYGALGALEMGERDVKYFQREYKKRKQLAMERMKALESDLACREPQGAYYLFPRILSGEADSFKFARDLLGRAQVAVVPGVAFGPSGESHFRINFGRSEEDLALAFDRMEEYFRSKKQ